MTTALEAWDAALACCRGKQAGILTGSRNVSRRNQRQVEGRRNLFERIRASGIAFHTTGSSWPTLYFGTRAVALMRLAEAVQDSEPERDWGSQKDDAVPRVNTWTVSEFAQLIQRAEIMAAGVACRSAWDAKPSAARERVQPSHYRPQDLRTEAEIDEAFTLAHEALSVMLVTNTLKHGGL